ncbi:hypothetical protein KC19_4G011400 [Ceratodon purpureus]|uniref:Uncharacterized protein n=1 Tax=Ceratodon purpureus TaxID=3225 RepID=A0A8T0I5A0_CERPU|nr:hypothetical protein KC19_4G011400 [Ceratodon purpureus]KAG0578288.1 hypothetical protein KC19_4G011400 [Ceratodon purpureus]
MAQPDDQSPNQLYLPFAQHHYGTGSDSETSASKTTTNFCPDESVSNQAAASTSSVQNLPPVQHKYMTQYSWAKALLLDCARAIADEDSSRIQSVMWILNESASPYGDSDQRIASYFVQALFCKITGTGARCQHSLSAAAEKTYCFESMRNMILQFQEASPWTTFGHVAGNGALMEAMEGEARIHIIDISSTFCTQWPTFLEALATQTKETPFLRLTTIVISPEEAAMTVMKQVMIRLDRFARLMGVPFESSVIQQPALEDLDLAILNLREDEALAINCIQTLHHISEVVAADDNQQHSCSPRDKVLSTFRSAKPKIMIIMEDEANLVWQDFVGCFGEALRFYSLYFESLEESFPRASNERLMLERNCGRKLVNLLSCDPSDCTERQETGVHWDSRLRQAGFQPAPFSPDVVDDVQALLKRYKKGWGLDFVDNRLYLTWKEQMVVCSTAWKLITDPSP